MSPATGRLLHGATIVLCLPFAAMGALMSANEYAAFDPAMASVVDCDGPIGVFMFAIPALIFYAGSAVRLFWTRARAPRWHIGMALLCSIVSVAVLPNTVRAFAADEQNRSEPACN